jgi:mono/diheme cytochrome c family protein
MRRFQPARACCLSLIAVCTAGLLGAAGAQQGSPALPPALEETVDFRRDIYPILKQSCFKCHQGSDASSGHRLDLRSEILGETNGKPLVKAGRSDQSRLIHVVAGMVPGKLMPRKGERLSDRQIGLLRAWIDQGLKWDDSLLPPETAVAHWSFRPVKAPTVPKVKDSARVRNPIDAFIAAAHEAKGLTPAGEAPPRVLLRRLSLDLTGLPPTPEEIEGFVRDAHAKPQAAYEEAVERLLGSPYYGERWARHWLDVARWAESEGYESNHLRPYAWRYRDWVVNAFNTDKPFRDFVREQLAGDEITPYADDNLIATGFLASARLSSNEEDKPRQRNDILVDITNATASAFLGLTMNCAQCHNHKFDPISARDYYRFLGFFLKGQPANLALQDRRHCADYEAKRPAEYEPAVQLRDALYEKGRSRRIAEVRKKLSPELLRAYDKPADQRTLDEERLARQADLEFAFGSGQIESGIPPEDRKLYDEVKKKIAAIEKEIGDRPQTFGFYSPVTSPTKVAVLPMKGFYPLPYEPAELARARPRLLVSGDVHRLGPELDVGWPAVFGPVPKETAERASRRALADWLIDPKHPLAARVYVNRLWQHHFGRGIVPTPGDFGTKGAPPTHPELLDWLAAEFLRSGGSTKHIHRLIVTSNTYRQSAQGAAGNTKIDPDNTYWWRWQPRRLEAEAIRDGMLAVSGELDRKRGGASDPADGKSRRRSRYVFQRRDHPPASQALFDGPSAVLESCPQRHVSTVPLQALYLLNNEFSLSRAAALARRVRSVAGDDRERQIETAFVLALGRRPDAADHSAVNRFFLARNGRPAAGEDTALVQLCQALLNLNEFVYIE